jgi:polysaccharide biosynthesis/export protein
MKHRNHSFKSNIPMRQFFYFLIMILFLSSCYKYPNLIYLRDDANMFSDRPTVIETAPKDYLIQPNDILNIRVQSTDAEVTDLFNMSAGANVWNQADPANMFLNGFSVDRSGNIRLPILGEINVANKTIAEIERQIQQEVDKYIINASVNVKLVTFKVTVLGEVSRPGQYFIYNGQANIFEVIGMAGDITPRGKKEGIKLLRQTDDATQVVLVDLTNPQLLVSTYYYVQPNDVIYVEPFKENTERENLQLLTWLSVIFGFVSTTVLILNYVNNN